MAAVKTKSIYEPRADEDGLRVLVTRYWPRGVKKNEADLWLKDLGPSPGLIKKWKQGLVPWVVFEKAYLNEHKTEEKKKAMNGLIEIVKQDRLESVTLMCMCREETTCHRGLLREMLIEKIGL
ncbi:MAG: DUF488 family protein [Deltaproteobacteria bacterium]